jgi:preprotein translocase subunit SecE
VARTRTRSIDQPEENNAEQNEAAVSDSRRRRRRAAGTPETSSSVVRKDRPTPSARQAKPKGGASSGLINRIPVVRSIAAYLRGVASELQKVTWPTREEATRLTAVVLGVTIAFAVTLGLLDLFLSWWFQQGFSKDSEPVFLAVAAGVAVVVGGTFTLLRNRI